MAVAAINGPRIRGDSLPNRQITIWITIINILDVTVFSGVMRFT